MRTLTGYGIAVVVIFVVLNGAARFGNIPRLSDVHRVHDLGIFSIGFVLGMIGMYLAAWLYGYRQMVP